MMPYYLVYRGQGRATLRDDLSAEDPFDVPPAEIVERVSALGVVPDVASPRDEPWLSVGPLSEVMSQDSTYLVAVSRDAEEISVQELRTDAYDPVE